MIDKIKQSTDFQNFIKEYQPFIIFLGGSRGYKYSTTTSDWDLIAFIDNYHGSKHTCQRIKINDLEGVSCHILVVSLEMVLDLLFFAPSHPDKLWEIIGLYYNTIWDSSRIIYSNNVPNIFYELINPDNHIKDHLLHVLVVGYGHIIRHILGTLKTNTLDMYYKLYYYFLLVWEIYSGGSSYTTLIKKIRTHANLNDEDYRQLEEVFNKILQTAEDYNILDYCTDYLYLEGMIWQHLQTKHPDLNQ